jgi:DNA-binding transcriptional regulator YdaS (Cro superfamily)
MARNFIKYAIDQAGTQKNLAKVLGVSQQYVANCKLIGYFPIHHAKTISKEFDIDVVGLVDPKIANLIVERVGF